MPAPDIQLAFGNAIVILANARPLARPSAGMYVPANLRGVMAAGLAGEIRVKAGRTVEAELLAQRPLALGRAYRTGPGRLTSLGVEALAHAVIGDSPGAPPKSAHAERALRSALEVLEEAGVREVTLPMSNVASAGADPAMQARAYGRLITGHLRRRSRFRRVTIAGLDNDFLSALGNELQEAGAIKAADSQPAR